MLQNMWAIFMERKDFFLNLLWEHLEISLLAIVIAVLFGGIVGIFISEFRKISKADLRCYQLSIYYPFYFYAWFFDSFFGDRKCYGSHCFDGVCIVADGKKYLHRNSKC